MYMAEKRKELTDQEYKKVRPPIIEIPLHPTCRTFVVKHVKE